MLESVVFAYLLSDGVVLLSFSIVVLLKKFSALTTGSASSNLFGDFDKFVFIL